MKVPRTFKLRRKLVRMLPIPNTDQGQQKTMFFHFDDFGGSPEDLMYLALNASRLYNIRNDYHP